MTIREAYNSKWNFSVEVDEVKKVSAINIGYINNDGKEEETQLDVHHNILTEEGISELEELFESLAEEFETARDKVDYIMIVASANTDEELEDMGF